MKVARDLQRLAEVGGIIIKRRVYLSVPLSLSLSRDAAPSRTVSMTPRPVFAHQSHHYPQQLAQQAEGPQRKQLETEMVRACICLYVRACGKYLSIPPRLPPPHCVTCSSMHNSHRTPQKKLQRKAEGAKRAQKAKIADEQKYRSTLNTLEANKTLAEQEIRVRAERSHACVWATPLSLDDVVDQTLGLPSMRDVSTTPMHRPATRTRTRRACTPSGGSTR